VPAGAVPPETMAAADRLHRLEVGDEGGERLDSFVAGRLGISRTRAVALIEQGRVRVEGREARKSATLAAGEHVSVSVPPPAPSALAAEPLPLEIVYQDEALLVVDKPAGMVVHPAAGHRSGTLVNALLHHVGDLSGIGGVLRPGIVHRLDRDTSGLMIVAKRDDAHRRLAEALKARRIHRAYLTAAWGRLPQDEVRVEAPIARHPRLRQRMAVVEGGRSAATTFRRLERWLAADLLEARLESGRTHQIRVHLQHLGHPVVGDPLYAVGRERGFSGPGRSWAAAFARRVPRLFLHAWQLAFRHPLEGHEMRFERPLPEDLAGAAEWARTQAP
jgi:23S rRNA pseudouridine1911/1915/1917 synthase